MQMNQEFKRLEILFVKKITKIFINQEEKIFYVRIKNRYMKRFLGTMIILCPTSMLTSENIIDVSTVEGLDIAIGFTPHRWLSVRKSYVMSEKAKSDVIDIHDLWHHVPEKELIVFWSRERSPVNIPFLEIQVVDELLLGVNNLAGE